MRRLLALTTSVLLAVSLAACGDDDDDDPTVGADTTEAGDESETALAGEATVAVADTDIGEVLVDATGMTLYLFTQDSDGTSACTDGCATTWPPVLVDQAATAADGVDEALLGTITRDDGGTQATYNGHPLYTYANDQEPGDTTGHGVGDVWFAVGPDGEAVS